MVHMSRTPSLHQYQLKNLGALSRPTRSRYCNVTPSNPYHRQKYTGMHLAIRARLQHSSVPALAPKSAALIFVYNTVLLEEGLKAANWPLLQWRRQESDGMLRQTSSLAWQTTCRAELLVHTKAVCELHR